MASLLLVAMLPTLAFLTVGYNATQQYRIGERIRGIIAVA
jgi:hypothetical protein